MEHERGIELYAVQHEGGEETVYVDIEALIRHSWEGLSQVVKGDRKGHHGITYSVR